MKSALARVWPRARLVVFLLLLPLILLAPVALSQMQPPPDPVDDAERQAVVERIAKLVADRYVFPDVGQATADHLRTRLQAGDFDALTDPDAFARTLTEAVQSVNHDKHMRVRYEPPRAGEGARPDPRARRREAMRRRRADNFGFKRTEILEGNVGYLKLDFFGPEEEVKETAVAALRLLENTDAMIFDLRENGGGNPRTIRFITSYFFDAPTHLNSLYWREGDRTEAFWTDAVVDGKQRPDVPIFVLTSNRSFSGAEEFAYNLRTRERATLVGETTRGGANPGGIFPLNERFGIFIPTGRAINPVTGTNWEGAGVEPHIKVPAAEALDVALEKAREAAKTYRDQQTEERRKG